MAAPTFHSVAQLAIGSAVGGVRSAALTVPSLTGGAVAVIPIWADSSAQSIASVAIDASALTAVGSTFVNQANSDGSRPGIQVWGQATPAAGSRTLSIGTSSAGLLTGAFVLFFEGADAAGPFGGGVTAFDATPNATPALGVTSTADELPIAICGAFDVFSSLAASQTAIGTRIADGIYSSVGWVAETAAGLSPSFGWTLTPFATGGNIQSGFVVKGVGGGGVSSIVRQMMQYHG